MSPPIVDRKSAVTRQSEIDEEIKTLRQQERAIQRQIETLQREYNRLGETHQTAIFPFFQERFSRVG